MKMLVSKKILGLTSAGSGAPITGIPRLTRFSITRIPIARIFEVVQQNLHSTVLYLKIYSVMQIFLTLFQVIL